MPAFINRNRIFRDMESTEIYDQIELSARRKDESLRRMKMSGHLERMVPSIRTFLSYLASSFERLQSRDMFWPDVVRAERYVIGRYAYWREVLPEKDQQDFVDFDVLIRGHS